MAITRWKPRRDMITIQDDMNRFFEDFFGRPMVKTEWSEGAWHPSVDISENKDNLIIQAEMPGMNKEEIEISLHQGSLIISGERKEETKEEDSEASRSERFFGRFQRALELPKPVDPNKVTANYKDGILTVTLPKTEESKPKQITVG